MLIINLKNLLYRIMKIQIHLNYPDKTNELEEVKKTLKPQAQTEYSKVVKFIQNNT